MAGTKDQAARILGLNFSGGGLNGITRDILDSRGLVTVPSAPCLKIAVRDFRYHKDLTESTLIVPDSGAMVLFARLRGLSPPVRVSGLALLWELFQQGTFLEDRIFLVNPSRREAEMNRKFLAGLGIEVAPEQMYLAPYYRTPEVEDHDLLEKLLDQRPRRVLVNLGGGVQERLGAWLQREWLARESKESLPTFLCTGAAIAFFAGGQGKIPGWADHLYLGWAVRCFQLPGKYLPRYFGAMPLLSDILRFGANSPHADR